MIAIYKKISKKELDKIYNDIVPKITKWFEDNPKRRICNSQWVYGEYFKIRRKHIKEDIDAMMIKTETI